MHAAFYAAGVDAAIAVDPYTGLLVNMHALALYAGVEGWGADLTPPIGDDLTEVQARFIQEQTALQRRLRQQLSRSSRFAEAVLPANLWPAYLRLRAWDRMSLFLVYDQDEEQAIDHVPTVDGEVTVTLRRIDEHTATVTPWPFQNDVAEVPVVVERLPDPTYQDGATFYDALSAASPVVEAFRFVRDV